MVVQLVRIPACHAGGRGFEPRPLRQSFWMLIRQYRETAKQLAVLQKRPSDWPFAIEITLEQRVPRHGGIAQLGERLHGMQEVSGSIPLTSTRFPSGNQAARGSKQSFICLHRLEA